MIQTEEEPVGGRRNAREMHFNLEYANLSFRLRSPPGADMPDRFALLVLFFSPFAFAGPVPPEFAQPQSPAKPAPFEVKYVDQGTFDPKLKGILAPAGFKLEIVADYPAVVNPVGLTFGPDGTPYVIEWAPDPTSDGRWFEFAETFRYRDGSTRRVATMKKHVVDPGKQFDWDAKGHFSKPRVIFSDELPSTLLYHDGWLYTASRGTVRRFKQSRPGGPWDVREVIAQGFCGFHHHQVSGLSIGNDGLLYITSGDDDNVAEGADGSRATVMRTGAIFRCNPDGTKLEEYSRGYRNPYRDLAHDDQFNWFHADNDNEDGSKFTGCRLMHVGEGMDYGWRLALGARCCRPDNLRGAVAGELPGKLPPMLKTGRGSPAGLLIYHDTKLPEPYRGLAFYPDVFRKLVRAYRFAPKDSSFEVTHEFEFLKSDDPLFRPCQMVTGPDGAIYCVDWRTDSGGAGKLWGDNQHGRIYRITHESHPLRPRDSWVKLLAQPMDDLVKSLAAPDLTDRVRARDELVKRNAGPAVLAKFADLPAAGKLPAMGVLARQWTGDVETLFIKLLHDGNPAIRRMAAESLGRLAKPYAADVAEALAKKLRDPDPTVRRSACLAVARQSKDAASILNAWKAEESRDPFLQDAYIRGIEQCGTNGATLLAELATNGNAVDLDRAVTAMSAMRTEPFAKLLPELLSNVHVTEGQKISLVRSVPNYQIEPPLPLEPIAAAIDRNASGSKEQVQAALDVLSSGGGLATPSGERFVLGLLTHGEWEVRSAAMAACDAGRVTAAKSALLALATDDKQPAPERTAAIKALRSVGDASVVKPLLAMLPAKAPAFLKTELLRTAGAFDPGAVTQAAKELLGSSEKSLQSEAIQLLAGTKDGAKLIGERFVEGKLSKEFLPRISDAVRTHLAKDASLVPLYEKIMKGGLTVTGNDLERIKADVVRKGNAARGKAIYLDTAKLACATCHKMEGRGGEVGPDLTRLWDTMTVEKIVESIVEPSKEIKEGYQAYTAETTAGVTVNGLKVSETEKDVTIRDATGRDVRIAKGDLETLRTSKLSLMPDNAVAQLSYDQLLDLLAFLKSKTEQESLREKAKK
jgi:putative membrane-bound dehydrogenase-like protein